MRKFGYFIGVFLAMFVIGVSFFFGATPTGKKVWNNWFHSVQVADNETNYQTKKNVEDTCRSMIASYNNDKLVYLQYKDSIKDNEIEISNNARTRANQTATVYNEYVLKNKYVWNNNIPSDIYMTLDII